MLLVVGKMAEHTTHTQGDTGESAAVDTPDTSDTPDAPEVAVETFGTWDGPLPETVRKVL